jgi:3-oxoacyl-[acyl-carrier-protein] synthase-3
LFGDAAVAVIIERAVEGGGEILHRNFENYPSGAYWAIVPAGGARDRGRGYPADHSDYFFKMEGRKLIKLACRHLDTFLRKMQSDTGILIQDVDYVVPHQASKLATEFLIRECGIPKDKVVNTLMQHGNCISASVPLGLEYVINESRPSAGKTILLIGSGAGFTLGSILLKV